MLSPLDRNSHFRERLDMEINRPMADWASAQHRNFGKSPTMQKRTNCENRNPILSRKMRHKRGADVRGADSESMRSFQSHTAPNYFTKLPRDINFHRERNILKHAGLFGKERS